MNHLQVGRAASMLPLDYLMYERTEGRWNYVSMDIRVPAGIMPAWSFDRGTPDHIALTFQPFAHGGAAAGQMLRREQVIARQDAAHDTKDQRFLPADGTGTSWLAHRYAYVRRVG